MDNWILGLEVSLASYNVYLAMGESAFDNERSVRPVDVLGGSRPAPAIPNAIDLESSHLLDLHFSGTRPVQPCFWIVLARIQSSHAQ